MRELKVNTSFNSDNQIVSVEPVNKADGKVVQKTMMIMRLYYPDEIDRETRECMQDGCRLYKRVNRRVREIR